MQGVNQRKGSRKVRTGCITCKIRRVKCDQRKDACLRCEKFGTRCDGYASENPLLPDTRSRVLAPKSQMQIIVPPNDRIAIPRLPTLKKSTPNILIASLAGPRDIAQLPSSHMFENAQRHRYFKFFCDQCSYQLTGCFESEFWNRLVLQASEREPSVRHAIVALGALSQKSFGGPAASFSVAGDSEDFEVSRLALAQHQEKQQYAIAEYIKSISMMRKALASGKLDIRTMLINCLLFTCFESMHNNNESALAQVQSGFKMLDNWYFSQRSSKVKPSSAFGIRSPRPGTVEDDLLQAFNRMDIQVMTTLDMRSEQSHGFMQFCGQASVESMPATFQDIKEARIYLELIMRRQLHFEAATMCYSHRRGPPTTTDPRQTTSVSPRSATEETTRSPSLDKQMPGGDSPPTPVAKSLGTTQFSAQKLLELNFYQIVDQILDKSPPIPKSIIKHQTRHASDLEEWHTKFRPILEWARTPAGEDKFFIATTLQTHYLTAKYSLLSSLFTTQMPYDQFLALFQEQIHLTEELLSHPDYSAKNGMFTFDCQIVIPLFACGIKCRDSRIRKRCIELLEMSSRHEGLWDGEVVSKVLKWVMRVEEEQLSDGETISEGNRLRGVRVDFDPLHKVLGVRCLRPSREHAGILDVLEATGQSFK